MFISEKDALARLSSTNNLLKRLGIPTSEPHSTQEKYPEETPKDSVDEALQEAQENPTIPSEDDAVRLAILAGRRHVTSSRGGRYPQQGNIPPIFRSLIGSAARMGTTIAAARAFSISPTQAHYLKHGKTSQDQEPSPSLLSKIERDTLAIRDQVLGVLAFTIAKITPDTIENKDPKELSIIARNLSSIMSSTKPTEIQDKSTNAQVIVFSPEQATQEYDTVEIG